MMVFFCYFHSHSPAFVVSFSHGYSNELVSLGVGYTISGNASLNGLQMLHEHLRYTHRVI